MVGLVVIMLAAAGRVKFHHVEGGAPTDLPEVAVCIAGAARSFATVPILRALKRNVLQSTSYSASAFAALSYDTFSPQVRSGGASHACAIASHTRAFRISGDGVQRDAHEVFVDETGGPACSAASAA